MSATDFIPGLTPPPLAGRTVRLLVFHGTELLLDPALSPCEIDMEWDAAVDAAGGDAASLKYLGSREGLPCFAVEAADGFSPPEGLRFVPAREALARGAPGFIRAVSTGLEVLSWDQSHRYCGRCGTAMVEVRGERARRCPRCGLVSYPRLSPAMIVAVTRGPEILLARAHRFAPGMYSVLAGFVEAGESLEECVHREIHEEVGIEVKQVRYFGSQSWPFPHSLMVAFTAVHERGEIRRNPDELADAGWYRREALPRLPSPPSIARRLIDDFVSRGDG